MEFPKVNMDYKNFKYDVSQIERQIWNVYNKINIDNPKTTDLHFKMALLNVVYTLNNDEVRDKYELETRG